LPPPRTPLKIGHEDAANCRRSARCDRHRKWLLVGDLRLSVPASDLVSHAGHIDSAGDAVDLAKQAADATKPSMGAYGKLCWWVPQMLGQLQQQDALDGLGKAAEAMAVITEGAGVLISTVRLLVRDAIAMCVSRLIVYAAEEAASLGFATPLVVEQVTTTVAAWAGKITQYLKALLASLRRLLPITRRLGELVEELKRRPSRCGRQAGVHVSYVFDIGNATVWSPALRIGSLFVTMAESLAAWKGTPSGLSAMASDYYEIDSDVFSTFVQTLARDDSAAHEIFGALTHGFIATCLVMLDRAGVPMPQLGSGAEAIIQLTGTVAARMAK
jgi:uncharacterized protein DUF6086